jgi:hypothetical protein
LVFVVVHGQRETDQSESSARQPERKKMALQKSAVVALVSSLSVAYAHSDSPSMAPLYLLGDYDSAKCLDGSPGAYYHRPALNSSFATKWVFSLQGGGECVDEPSCADRATGDLGSSNNYASDGSGFMSQFQDANEAHNPDFYGWNHVRLKLLYTATTIPAYTTFFFFFSGYNNFPHK